MNHLPDLIKDLGLILCTAAVVTLVFKKLKQPIVLGYILAGMLVGRHVPFAPTITDTDSIDVWAQIGVIILLFSLGLEFSFKKLVRVGGAAFITALTEVGVMLCVGFLAGRALGWKTVDCIFLGAIVSISSTTIIIRAFEELGVKEKKFASLVFGVLIVQDLVAIVMLALLPAVVMSSSLSGSELLMPLGKLVFFLIIWFASGIFFLPTILRKAGKIMNDEMLLITSLALCFLMVILATKAGFSPALGAFVMGSILAETRVGGKIEHLTLSVKELFGAIFFVSVGMMINPAIIPLHWKPILLIAAVTIIFQPLSAMTGALLSRQPLKSAVQAGMSMSQIGEFSFIIASLGLSLNITSAFLYPIAVAVSALTTFTTPYMIRASTPMYNMLYAKMPDSWRSAIDRFSSNAQSVKSETDWNKFIRAYLLNTVIYTTLIIAIVFLVSRYALPAFAENKQSALIGLVATLVTLPIIAPFLWALSIRKIQPDAAARLWRSKSYRAPLVGLQVIRFVLGTLVIGFLVRSLLSDLWALALLGVLILLLALAYRRLQVVLNWIERRFMTNFNEKEKFDAREQGKHLTPWDAHITRFIVTPDFSGVGQPLVQLQLREKFGVNIAMIKRGTFTIQAPDQQERLYPEDMLYVIGTDDQIVTFKKHLQNSNNVTSKRALEDELSLLAFEVGEDSLLAGKTIKESSIRERTKGLIVGIERNNERLLNPESTVILNAGDLLWIVGNKRRIKVLEKISAKPQ
ncbi:MAG: cation:proton antiporter [Bacteroidota bacterium]